MKDHDKHGRTWDGGEIHDAWPAHATRATVVIESGEKESVALLLDEGGMRGQFRVATHKVSAFLDVLTRGWSQHKGYGSVAVLWQRGSVMLGVVAPPPPPPPPGPVGDGLLVASALQGHHSLLAVAELAGALGRQDIR